MLENNEIDRLFKSELTKTREFGNRQNQWAIVYARLRRKKRSILFWVLPFLLLAIITIFLVNKTNLIFGQDKTLSDKNTPLELTNQAQAQTALEGTDNSAILMTNEETKSPSLKSSSTLSNYSDNRIEKGQLVKQKSESNSFSDQNTTKDIPFLKEDFFEPKRQFNQNSNSNSLPSNTLNSNYGLEESASQNSSILSNNEPINKAGVTNNILLIPFTKSLFPKPLLHYREIEQPTIFNRIRPAKSNHFVFSINTGLFIETIKQDSLYDKRNIGWSIGAGVSTSKVSLKIGYKKNKIERLLTSSLAQYNIIDSSIVYGYERPDSVNLIYNNQLLYINIGYKLISKGRINWEIFSGIQARRISSGNIKFAYGGVYNPLGFENEIPSQKFQFSDLSFGSVIQYNLYKSFGLTLQYNLAISLDIASIKWPRRHQFELGLTYYLN